MRFMTCGCRQVNPKMAQNLIAALRARHTNIDAHVSKTKPKTAHGCTVTISTPKMNPDIHKYRVRARAVSGLGSGCCGPKHGCLVQQHDHRGVPCCCGRHPPPALLGGA